MHIVILGSGVIGTTAAYYLARAGHRVTVVDRCAGPGLETSFANAGEVSPGYSAPWAGPGVPLKALRWLLMHHRPLVIRPLPDPALWRWCAAMLRNCTAERYRINKGRMVRLAEYSRDTLCALRADTGIAYDERRLGTLQLFRTQRQLDGVGKDLAVLDGQGVPYQLLDRDAVAVHEPALATVQQKYAGGLRLPGDETGDCYLFTRRLAETARRLGVEFRFGTTVRRIEGGAAGVEAVHVEAAGRQAGTDPSPDDRRREGNCLRSLAPPRREETLRADLYLVAAGSHSTGLVAPLGLRLPVYPVKGYSLTLAIDDAARAPVSTVMDETHKVAITRLGGRIRVGGMAQLSGFDLALDPRRRETLEFVVSDLFPGAGDVRSASFWTGLRPMTPDGTPILGPTAVPRLWLATGHGTLGWTMAAGTGRLLADWIGGGPTEIDTEGLTLARYGRAGRRRAG